MNLSPLVAEAAIMRRSFATVATVASRTKITLGILAARATSFHMIDVCRLGFNAALETIFAQRLSSQLFGADFLPLVTIAALCRTRPLRRQRRRAMRFAERNSRLAVAGQ
jgi:hypothetical protein